VREGRHRSEDPVLIVNARVSDAPAITARTTNQFMRRVTECTTRKDIIRARASGESVVIHAAADT